MSNHNHESEKRFTEITENIFKEMVKVKPNEDGIQSFSRSFFEENEINELVDIFITFYNHFQSHYSEVQLESVESMLRHFFRQKLSLYKLLGSVRISREVEVEQDLNSFLNNFKGMLEEESVRLTDITEHPEVTKEEVIKVVEEIHNIEIARNGSLFANEFNTLFNNYSDSHDMKVSKVFATLFGADNFITTTYSNLIQNNTLKETVYISLSPLDYLTMSENSYNWQSCLRIKGEWGGGSQSYIMDDSTVVSFIGNYRESFIGLDKKWRQLIYLQHNGVDLTIAQSRQYPNTIDTIEEEVRRILFNQINEYVGENLSYSVIEYPSGYLHQESNGCHYYDLNDDHYGAETSHRKISKLGFMGQIGNVGICLSCGEPMESDNHYESFVCRDCEC
jgi:hypothetical protein